MSDIEVKIGKLETKLDYVIQEIKDLRDNFAGRLERVEVSKLSASDFINYRTEQEEINKDHETRIRFGERFLYGALAILGIINFIGVAGFIYLINHLK